MRDRIVAKACNLVEGSEHTLITVSELCLKLGVPIRTLDEAFQACLGIAPKQFIMRVRLNNVRRCLSRHPSDRLTITDAASRYGFFHFGHFGSQYRRLFGETPSLTLSRARS